MDEFTVPPVLLDLPVLSKRRPRGTKPMANAAGAKQRLPLRKYINKISLLNRILDRHAGTCLAASRAF
jgi:hypothetical protein